MGGGGGEAAVWRETHCRTEAQRVREQAQARLSNHVRNRAIKNSKKDCQQARHAAELGRRCRSPDRGRKAVAPTQGAESLDKKSEQQGDAAGGAQRNFSHTLQRAGEAPRP